MFDNNNENSNLTTTSIKGAILMALVFIGLLLWHAAANATPLAHWANFRQANGDLIDKLPAGTEVTVISQGTAVRIHD